MSELRAAVRGLRLRLDNMTQERDAAIIRAGCASVGVEALKQERDALRREVALKDRQISLLAHKCYAKIEMLQAMRPTTCDFCPAHRSPLCRESSHSCPEIVIEWARIQATKAGKDT